MAKSQTKEIALLTTGYLCRTLGITAFIVGATAVVVAGGYGISSSEDKGLMVDICFLVVLIACISGLALSVFGGKFLEEAHDD